MHEVHIGTMAATAVTNHGGRICVVESSPDEVDAGAEVTVTVRASCPHGCDLTGQRVVICTSDGAELAAGALAAFDGDEYAGVFALRTPRKAGHRTYEAALPACVTDGVAHEATAVTSSFTTTAHAATVNVWGMPSAIAAGEQFRFKVGVKCSAGCNLAGRPVEVCDQASARVIAESLRDVWPGTSALYFTEIEAQAPPSPGDHAWRVEAPAWDASLPHAAGAATFTVKVVQPPDHIVTVAAFDRDTQSPVAGAHVLLHPYRAFTDAQGVAKIKVAKGRYSLVVSGFNYMAFRTILDVTGDVAARAELATEPEGLEDYR